MDNENMPTRRKFIAIGATSAAALLGLNVAKSSAATPPIAFAAKAGSHSKNSTINSTDSANNQVFDNLAAMQLNMQVQAGDVVSTLGYYRAGDGGDNHYTIVASDNNADGGSLVQLQNGLKAQAIFPGGEIRIEQFGAIGLNHSDNTDSASEVFDNTEAMLNAHRTGKTIKYDAKTYYFSSLTINEGGITGQGERTVLVSFDESPNSAITFSGNPATQMQQTQLNHFVLQAQHSKQKTQGAGLHFTLPETCEHPSQQAVVIQNVKIAHFPTSIHTHPQASFTLRDSVLSNFSQQGLLIGEAVSQEEQTLHIHGNVFQTAVASAVGIAHYSGNLQVSNNSIAGGKTGIQLSSATCSTADINHNTIKQQLHCTIHLTDAHLSPQFNQKNKSIQRRDSRSGQVIISQNQLTVASEQSSVINIAKSNHFSGNVSVNNNLISYAGGEESVAAIFVKNLNGFMINNNTINCNSGKGNRGLYIGEDCNNGILSANHVIMPRNGHTLNKSITTTVV